MTKSGGQDVRRPHVRAHLAARRAVLGAAIPVLAVAVALVWRLTALAVVAGAGGPMVGRWVPLSELEWQEGSTGWVGVANQSHPALDRSFAGGPLRIGGHTFASGVGTYPVSEITYRLDGQYSHFSAWIGVDDATSPGPDGARFLVFVDEVPRYQSDVRRPGDLPAQIEINVVGARTLRLAVVDVRPTDAPVYADWADSRLLQPVLGTPVTDLAWERQVQDDHARRAVQNDRDEGKLAERSAALLADVERLLGAADRSDVQVVHEPAAGWLALGNERLLVVLDIDGVARGRLAFLDRRTGRLVFDWVSPALAASRSTIPMYRLATDAEPGRWSVEAIDSEPFGRGQQVVVDYPLRDHEGTVGLRLALFAGQPYFLYELSVRGRIAAAELRFHFLEPSVGEVVLGDGAEYVTDFSRLRHAAVRDDGLLRRESIGPGKPLFLWSERTARGLLLAALDETRGSTHFAVERRAGRVVGAVLLATGPRRDATTPGEVISPRLYVELPPSIDLRQTHANFKRISAALYPPAPLPVWARYQWISWYAFNVGIDEENLRAQIDSLARNLADLGPWNILVDAGWYVAEGRDGADWRNVDRDKFPSGLRALVDYAHSRGIRVVGYLSTPYLDSRERPGDWLGLRRVIEEHRDWLIELGSDEARQSFAFDFANPEVRAYWAAVIRDLLVEYDVDGIKIDGLGNAEGAQLAPGEVDFFGRVEAVADQTMDIYRFISGQATGLKPDVYLQTGWLTPTLAHPYAHTFWYGDDYPAFSNAYPFPGLREHVDYAIVQRQLLGQRAHMGNIYDDPNGSTINRWWLGAGLALGTKVALSFDLTSLSPEDLAAYRSLLVHYNAFTGETRFGPGLYPDYFATTVGGTTYLGLINRDDHPRTISPSFVELGLDEGAIYTAFDVEEQRFFRVLAELPVELAGQSFRLIILRRDPGVIWTDSSFNVRSIPRGLEIAVRGPTSIPGDLHLAVPEPRSVSIDGRPSPPASPGGVSWRGHWYDAEAGVLQLRYSHRLPHRIRVTFG
ncbi:MAG: NPCBM/NEW2 domain-containing protein [Chloroflexi bacterium]|nr:NPCBM/NEW2 domain-containing protein [Chloroflexota bacterium]